MGRTGSPFALEQEGIAVDIATLAKGLGARYLLIATVMASEKSWLPFRLVRANCGTRTRTCPMWLPVQGASR
jgi:4-aminobutyrate aminotransferase-like enzyme